MNNGEIGYTSKQKEEIIKRVFGDETPTYQWFGLNVGAGINREEINEIADNPGFGNLEIHGSRYPTGFGLRVRNAEDVITEVPQELKTGEKKPAELYQAVNNPFNPKDGWVDFLNGGTITSSNPEHEEVAKEYGMSFNYFKGHFQEKALADRFSEEM